ncbi:MAG: hypothetical protein IMZ67_07225, partial [Acidobacteria bacterium]|nr:hypothetical protein [Acidobacteriota bacterium]
PDGRLRRLATLSPAVSPAQRLLDQPRSDFSAVFEMKLQVPGQGGAYTAGIIRGGAGALSPVSGQPVRLRALARATPETGSALQVTEREIYASVLPDGSFVTSYGFTLPPARYAVSIGLFDPASEKGTVTTVTIDSPDFGARTLVVGPLVVSSDANPPVTVPGADPYAAFAIGAERLVPRPENALSQSDSLMLLVLVHNAALDPNTSRASLRAAFSVLQDGKVVAKGKDQVFDTAAAAASVGPVALTAFQPGYYVARVEVEDGVAKIVVVRESAFEVRR